MFRAVQLVQKLVPKEINFLTNYRTHPALTTSINRRISSDSNRKQQKLRPEMSMPSAKEELALFDRIFDKIRSQLVTPENNNPDGLEEMFKWYKEMLDYTCFDGKKNRGISAVTTYRALTNELGTFNDYDLERSQVLGWCIEILQAYFLVLDDIMDGSITRRGKPCWYKKVGMVAINDGILLETSVYKLLKEYFGKEKYYGDLIDLFLEVNRKTIFGQTLDLLSTPPDTKVDLNRFSHQRMATIMKYKTAYYSFSLPIRAVLYMLDISDPKSHDAAERVLLKIGYMFQCNDDYLDLQPPEVIGKIGTDIEDGKCSWPVLEALKVATPEQRQIIADNYGRKDSTCVQKIKDLYQAIGLDDIWTRFEEQQYKEICQDIDRVVQETNLPYAVFKDTVDRVYKRQK